MALVYTVLAPKSNVSKSPAYYDAVPEYNGITAEQLWRNAGLCCLTAELFCHSRKCGILSTAGESLPGNQSEKPRGPGQSPGIVAAVNYRKKKKTPLSSCHCLANRS